jgi:nucleosome binding factor SPN SPT16 subunit
LKDSNNKDNFISNNLKNNSFIYIKEVILLSNHIFSAQTLIKTIKRFHKIAMENEKNYLKSSAEHMLLRSSFVVPVLCDVSVKPTFGYRCVRGTLEALTNGFRFSSSTNHVIVEFTFTNIKHAIFQPAENEAPTLIHFRLHKRIIINKKSSLDIQFFVEVLAPVQTLEDGMDNNFDEYETIEPKCLKKKYSKIVNEFFRFTRMVQNTLWKKFKSTDIFGKLIKWDMPYRKLAFDGVPQKSMATLVPTNDCLIELSEVPFTVITLDEIEIINLERVSAYLRNFDMIIVNKDFKIEVLRIKAIPMNSLRMVRAWLNSVGITFYECQANLNWKYVLKAITTNPLEFQKKGGWEFLKSEPIENKEEMERDGEYYPEKE